MLTLDLLSIYIYLYVFNYLSILSCSYNYFSKSIFSIYLGS
jgi:hypothetical protein